MGKGSDPSDFEPEFVLDDADGLSRSSTPKPALARSDSSTKDPLQNSAEETQNVEGNAGKALQDGPTAAPQELPTDVKVKLRKLDKLESRYHGILCGLSCASSQANSVVELLRSYKLAHSRVQIIDTFEASLRENTPLTSISDPRALVEYLNQLNLKGDLVVDELKRVSHERDTYKQQVDDAEQRARDAWDEVTNLCVARDTDKSEAAQPSHDIVASPTALAHVEQTKSEQSPSLSTKSPTSPAKSRTGSLPSLSIFSPKSKPVESPLVKEVSEDLFSMDDEIPRLQSEVKERDTKIRELQSDVTSLRGDLAVTRESTQSMVQSLEEATRDLNSLRDHKDRSAGELEEQRQASKKLSDKLEADLRDAEEKLRKVEAAAKSENSSYYVDLEQRLNDAHVELRTLRQGDKASDGQLSEVEILRERLGSLTDEMNEVRAAKEQSEKKVETLNSLMKSVRDQLAEKERLYTDLSTNKDVSDQNLQKQIRRLEEALGTQQSSQRPASQSINKPATPAGTSQAGTETADVATSGKRKNKKKKKGGPPAGEPLKELETAQKRGATADISMVNQKASEADGSSSLLQAELETVRQQLKEKQAALEKMQLRLKDQEDLKEEIESLRDDLVNVGQEHVAAKDRIKELQAEKNTLQECIADLERQVADMQNSHASSNSSSAQKHQDLTAQFEDLKAKAATLQTDLSAAEQLATSRFKDLNELRTMMQKAQPELTSLRSEVNGLRTFKTAHDEKVKEINRIESEQVEMRNEVATQKQVLVERDTEIRSLRMKLTHETNARSQVEDGRKKATQDIERLETEKRQGSESLDKLSKDLTRASDELRTEREVERT